MIKGLLIANTPSGLRLVCPPTHKQITDHRWKLSRAEKDDKDRLVFTFTTNEVEGQKLSPTTSGKQVSTSFARRNYRLLTNIEFFGSTQIAENHFSDPQTLIVTMPHDLNEYIKRKAAKRKQNTTETEVLPELPPLRVVVSQLNDHKRRLSDSLILEVQVDGTLKALVEYV